MIAAQERVMYKDLTHRYPAIRVTALTLLQRARWETLLTKTITKTMAAPRPSLKVKTLVTLMLVAVVATRMRLLK